VLHLKCASLRSAQPYKTLQSDSSFCYTADHGDGVNSTIRNGDDYASVQQVSERAKRASLEKDSSDKSREIAPDSYVHNLTNLLNYFCSLAALDNHKKCASLRSAKCNDYFLSFSSSLYQTWILLMKVNMPDVMTPYYHRSPSSSMFFVVFTVFTQFFFLRLILAASFTNYKNDYEHRHRRRLAFKNVAILKAFTLLSKHSKPAVMNLNLNQGSFDFRSKSDDTAGSGSEIFGVSGINSGNNSGSDTPPPPSSPETDIVTKEEVSERSSERYCRASLPFQHINRILTLRRARLCDSREDELGSGGSTHSSKTTQTRPTKRSRRKGERAKRASLLEDEHTSDESREMATDEMATSTTKLTLFHSILMTRSPRPCLINYAHNLASLGAVRTLSRSRLG